jgi:hypothetical protein
MSGDFRVIFPPGNGGEKRLTLSEINEETCAIGEKPIARHQVLVGETGRREKKPKANATAPALAAPGSRPRERRTGESAPSPDRNGSQQ